MGSPFMLSNGAVLLTTEAPGGVYNSTQLKKIASLSEGNAAVIRATEDQRIALIVAATKVADVTKELKATGLGVRHYQDGIHQPVACVGSACPEHQQDALASAFDVTKAMSDVVAESPLKIGINGCARCCVPCHTFDVAVIGESNGYRISLGGKNSQIPEFATFMAEGVPPKELPSLLKKVVQLYRDNAEPGERLQEVMERVGSSQFIKVLAPYSQDAAGSDAGSDPFGATPDLVANDDSAAGDELADLGADGLEASADAMAGESLDQDLALETEASNDAVAITEDAALATDDLEDASLATKTAAIDELGELETMDDLTPSAMLADGGDVSGVDDIDPSGHALAPTDTELAGDVLISDDELEATHPAVAYDNAAPVDESAIDGEAENSGTPSEELSDLDDIAALEAMPEETTDVAAADSEEDEIERKLTASIDETGATPIEEDENAADREAAASMIDNVGALADDELEQIDEAAVLEDDGALEDLDSETLQTTDDHSNVAAISPSAGAARPKAAAAVDANRHNSKSSQGWDVSGLDMLDDGRIVVRFASGVELRLDPSSVDNGDAGAEREINFGGKIVKVATKPDGVGLVIDGIEMFLPRRSAA